MSARDDYRWLADQELLHGDTSATLALNEIDQLRSEVAKLRKQRDGLMRAEGREPPAADGGVLSPWEVWALRDRAQARRSTSEATP